MNKRLLLLLFPIATLVISIFVVMEREPYYSCWSDPTYCYLFNGLNIASGHFKVGQVDHPGTPLQIFSGGAIKLFHFFSNDKNLVHDVLARPEWYLFRIGILQSIVVSFCMMIAGWMMMRFTQNIFYALIAQLTLIASFHALFFSQNLMTEFILACCGILLAPLLVQYTFDDKLTGTKKNYHSRNHFRHHACRKNFRISCFFIVADDYENKKTFFAFYFNGLCIIFTFHHSGMACCKNILWFHDKHFHSHRKIWWW